MTKPETLDAWADLKFVQRVLEGNQRTADDEAALTIVKTLRNMVWDRDRATAEPVLWFPYKRAIDGLVESGWQWDGETLRAPAASVAPEPIGWLFRGGTADPVRDTDRWEYSHGPDEPYLAWTNQEKKPVYAALSDVAPEQEPR